MVGYFPNVYWPSKGHTSLLRTSVLWKTQLNIPLLIFLLVCLKYINHRSFFTWCSVGISFESSLWTSYQIRKIAGCACAGNAGSVFPRRRLQRKPPISDPGMHHGTCVTHVPWCMSGSLTRGGGENVPGIPDACTPAILRIWQEAHALNSMLV